MKSFIIILTVMLCSIITKAQYTIDTTSVLNINSTTYLVVNESDWLKVINNEFGYIFTQASKAEKILPKLKGAGILKLENKTVYFIQESIVRGKYNLTLRGYINGNKIMMTSLLKYPF